MGLTRLDTLGAVKIHSDGMGSAVIIGAADNYSLNLNPDVRQDATSGYAWSTFQSLYNLAPQMSFSTNQVLRLIDAVGLSGLAIASATNAGLVAYGQQKAEGGMRKSGSVHISETVREGLLMIRGLSCQHLGDLMVNCEALITYDGTNALVTQSSIAALPTIPIDDQRLSLGKVMLGTGSGDQITLEQKTQVDIELGLEAEALSADGDVFPTMAVINKAARPVIRITTLKTNLLSSSGVALTGKDIDLSHTVVYFRQRGRTASGYDADDAGTHVLFTPVAGMAYHTTITRSANANGTAVIEIPLIGDASNFPISVTTAADIT